MALRLDASGDYLRRTTSLPTVSNLTACGWHQILTNNGIGPPIFACSPEVVIYFVWDDFFTPGSMVIGSFDGAVDNNNHYTSRPALGDWFFWYVRCSGTGANQLQSGWRALGSNSFAEQRNTTINSAPSLTSVSIASDLIYSGWSDCRNAGVKVWDAVLTDAELLAESYTLRPQRWSNLHLWTPMVSATVADAVKDHSGAGKDWTAGGTLAAEDGPPVSWGASGGVVSIAGPAAYTLTADSGSYALTGSAAALTRTTVMPAASGTYAVSGTDAALYKGRTLAADSGSYELTGASASLLFARTLAAAAGTYALTGTAAALQKGRTLAAEAGAYLLSGADAALNAGRKITAASGSYALTGAAAAFTKGRTLAASAGAYALTGTAVAFGRKYVMAAISGVYALTGTAASLRKGGVTASVTPIASRTNAAVTSASAATGDVTPIASRTQVTAS